MGQDMTEMIPASEAVKSESPAPVAAETDKSAEQGTTPEAAKAADGAEAEKVETEEKELTPGELKRKERNRERWRERQERLENAERRAAQAEAELAKIRSSPKLDRNQFEDPDEYVAALSAQKVRESFAQDHETVAKQARQEAAQEVFRSWDAIKKEARQTMPDFDQYVNDDTPIHARMARPLIESDVAAEVAYYLGRNPEEAKALYEEFEFSPARALRKLGRIEAQVSKPSPKTHSSAPKPAPILSGSSSPPAFDPKSAGVSEMQAILRKAGILG